MTCLVFNFYSSSGPEKSPYTFLPVSHLMSQTKYLGIGGFLFQQLKDRNPFETSEYDQILVLRPPFQLGSVSGLGICIVRWKVKESLSFLNFWIALSAIGALRYEVAKKIIPEF